VLKDEEEKAEKDDVDKKEMEEEMEKQK